MLFALCLDQDNCGWGDYVANELSSCEMCDGPIIHFTADYWLDTKRKALTGVAGIVGGDNAPTETSEYHI